MDHKQIKFIFLLCLLCSTSANMQVLGQLSFQVVQNNPAINLLDAGNHHRFENQPAPLPSMPGERRKRSVRYLPVTDALVSLNGEIAVYDPRQRAYLIKGKQDLPYHLSVKHPDFQDYELKIEKGEVPLPTTLVLAGKEELIYTMRGIPLPVPDPNLFAQPACMQEGVPVPVGSIMGTEGCILGTFDQVDQQTFQDFLSEFDIPLHEIDRLRGWFAIAPGPGTSRQEFHQQVLPILASQPWVRAAGPVLASNPEYHQFLNARIYIEVKGGHQAALENYLKQNKSITTIRSCTDKPGYNLRVDPLLGTQILPLAKSLADHPQVVYADVHLNRIILADLRD